MNTKKWTKAVKDVWKEMSPSQKVEIVGMVGTAPVALPISASLGVGYIIEDYMKTQAQHIKAKEEIKKLKKKLRSVV